MCTLTLGKNTLEVRAIDQGIFRVRLARDGQFHVSLVEKYGFLMEPETDYPSSFTDGAVPTLSADQCSVSIDREAGALTFHGPCGALTVTLPTETGKGFHLELGLNETERIYGLGDNGRDSLNKRGKQFSIWQTNKARYSPIPYLMSSRGWAVLFNNTFRQELDVGCTRSDAIQLDAAGGTPDFYVFLSDSMLKTIGLYTQITGKPNLLPKFGYGSTYIMNMEIDMWHLLQECLNFRREDIPCDIVSLEPGWMDKFYNFSTEKKWSPERFHHPTWLPENTSNYCSIFYNLRKMGFKFTLWMCCEYDLLWEEEKTTLFRQRSGLRPEHYDDPWAGYNTLTDKLVKHGEPWFEHLKKFVDNGAVGFKLDGANQVFEHPDRLWAGQYTDDEVHNVYPLIYARQMQQGFTDYTGRRPMLFTVAMYSGSQHYAATWAGDTGGGPGSLVSILNLAMCGHSNASTDIEENPAGLHFGHLIPWTQHDHWTSWNFPWYLSDEDKEIRQRYGKLRASLFPYLYSMAHKAAKDSIPMARPMCLMYPEDEAIADATNIYMLGDSLLVGAFDMHMRLPQGKWRDLFTGDIYDGGVDFTYEVPEGWGGALFAKEGAVWVTENPKPYVEKVTKDERTIHIFPGKDGTFDWIEDDGITYQYLNGGYATTHMSITQGSGTDFTFTLKQRTGGYTVEATEAYQIGVMGENHRANVKPLEPVTGFNVHIYVPAPMTVTCDAEPVDTVFENGTLKFHISKEDHENGDLTFRIG